jgi:hypothetical protein
MSGKRTGFFKVVPEKVASASDHYSGLARVPIRFSSSIIGLPRPLGDDFQQLPKKAGSSRYANSRTNFVKAIKQDGTICTSQEFDKVPLVELMLYS